MNLSRHPESIALYRKELKRIQPSNMRELTINLMTDEEVALEAERVLSDMVSAAAQVTNALARAFGSMMPGFQRAAALLEASAFPPAQLHFQFDSTALAKLRTRVKDVYRK